MAKRSTEGNARKQSFTIGEIGKMYGIGPDALRYYERKGILHPMRAENGYRHYTMDDIWRLNVIRQLRELDIAVERIGSFFEQQSVETTERLFRETLEAVNERRKSLDRLKDMLEGDLAAISAARRLVPDTFVIEDQPDRRAFVIEQPHSESEETDLLMKQLADMADSRMHLIGNHQMADILAPEGSPQIYSGTLIFAENGDRLIPGGKYLSYCYTGEPDSRARAAQVLQHAKENHMEPVGPVMDIIWLDVHTTTRLDEQINEIQVRLR